MRIRKVAGRLAPAAGRRAGVSVRRRREDSVMGARATETVVIVTNCPTVQLSLRQDRILGLLTPRPSATKVRPPREEAPVTADLKYAWRAITRMPVLATVVILSIGVGIGVNTAVFSWIQ